MPKKSSPKSKQTAQAGQAELELDVSGQEEFDKLWLVEALRLVRGERRRQYGHIFHNWKRLRLIGSAIFGVPVTFTQIAYFIIAMKMCRELSNEHPDGDNNRDIAGFIQCLQDAKTYEEEQQNAPSGSAS